MNDEERSRQELIEELVRLRERNELLEGELTNARGLLQAIMEHVPEGITIATAPDVSIRMVSKYGEELVGRSRDVIEGIPVDRHVDVWDIFRSDGISRASNEDLPLSRATLNGEVVVGEEWVLRKPDGAKVTLLCNAGPIRDEHSRITGGIIAWRDITERRRAEEELRKAHDELELKVEERTADLRRAQAEIEAKTKLLDAVLSQMPSGVIIAEVPSGKLIIGNKRVKDIFRHDFIASEGIRDYTAYRGFHPDGEPYEAEEWPLARTVQEGEVVTNEEISILRGDGTYGTILVSSCPVFDHEGALSAGVAVFYDLTQRKQMEEDLRASEDLFRKAFDHVPVGMVLTDLDGRFQRVNPAYCRITGYSEEELLQPKFDFIRLTHPEDRKANLEEFDRVVTGEIPAFFVEKRYCRKDGRIVWVRTSATVRRDQAGSPFQIVGIVEDITERRRMEEELRRARYELEMKVQERTVSLREKSENLEEVNTALRVLLRQRAEDKEEMGKSILTNVRNLIVPYIDRLKKSPLSNTQLTWVDILESHIHEITSSFSRTLAFQCGNMTPTEMRIAALIRDGKSTADIADLLCVSEKTVCCHRDRIREKLGLRGGRTNLRLHLMSLT